MQLTGQPMVDVGMAIAAILNGKLSVNDLTEDEIRSALVNVLEQTNHPKKKPGPIDKLKILSSYWQNNPMIGLNLGKEDQNLAIYRNILKEASSLTPKTSKGYCQICGRNEIFIDANRSWFPLGSSSESDPCSLPGLQGKFLCTACFSAIVLLPLGCKFIGGNPYLFHLTDPLLICEANKTGVKEINRLITANVSGNNELKARTRLSGRLALLDILSGSRLWDENQGGILSKKAENGATLIAFSNSGTSAAWYQLHLPTQALDFFAELDEASLRNVFLKWAEPCSGANYTDRETKQKRPNTLFEALCDSVEQRRSFAPLVNTILRRKSPAKRILTKEERKVLEIYENVALGKEKRFQLLVQIANRVKGLKTIYRDSFVKQLGNLNSKQSLWKLLRDFAKKESVGFRLTEDEIHTLDAETSNEIVSLLYLLCIAEE